MDPLQLSPQWQPGDEWARYLSEVYNTEISDGTCEETQKALPFTPLRLARGVCLYVEKKKPLLVHENDAKTMFLLFVIHFFPSFPIFRFLILVLQILAH